MAMPTRSYKEALEKLNSQQSNAATLNAIRASKGRLNDLAIQEMVEYLRRVGHTPEELNSLNVIHVTGTKGKGSTCAFCDSILRESLPGKKIGLYTSPHIIAVRERIRVNGSPISEEDFARYFFEVWDMLENSDKPMYFRLVTLVAFHAYISLKMDAVILEVGIGGRYDSTNIVPKPIVTGVTSLGLDHVNVLGNTLGEIAWNKAGIFKPGVPALTVEQPEEGLSVLQHQAKELMASEFEVVSIIPELQRIRLGLAGSHQIGNASLAVKLAQRFIQACYPSKTQGGSTSSSELSRTVLDGLQGTRWPGRCQQITDPRRAGTTWFLDGSHTIESLRCGIEWFATSGVGIQASVDMRILIFNCTHGRSGKDFLSAMLESGEAHLKRQGLKEVFCSFFTDVIFCTNTTYNNGACKADFYSSEAAVDLSVQETLSNEWQRLLPTFPSSRCHVFPSIQGAVEKVDELRTNSKTTNVLVCGSLHLVGGLIEVAELADVAL